MKLLISGSVGSGKSTIAKELSKKLDLRVYEVSDLEKINPSVIDFIDEDGVKILSFSALNDVLNNLDDYIFPCHMAHLLDVKDSKLLIVRANLSELKKRLEKRGYSEKKIRDNLDVEIFNTIALESKNHKGFDMTILNEDGKLNERIKKVLDYLSD